jgi:GNAT superfamily N-acetyltransferase
VVADPVLLIEQLAVNAWPAATVRVADGWLLRHTPTVARRRSNSALPPPSAALAGPARRARVLDLAERIRPRTGFLTATGDGEVLGVGLLVVERGWAGVFCMATRPEARGRGVATVILGAGARWAATQVARNLPALRLYERLGFHPSHHYHYRLARSAGSAGQVCRASRSCSSSQPR